ncbi:MAG: phytoene desaturase family protein [Candidatus Helarchaeota archaeon]
MKKNGNDVIIIGSGIGGSACAALLSHAGFSTLVLEKNEQIGGFTSCYEKQGFIVDISIHVFSNGINGRFGKILQRIGLATKEKGKIHSDYLKFVPNLEKKTAIRMPNQKNYLSMGSMLQGQNIMKPGTSSDKIQKSISNLGMNKEDINSLMKVFMTMMGFTKRKIRKLEEQQLTLKDYIDSFTKSPFVHSFLAFTVGGMFAVSPRRASAAEFVRGIQEWFGSNDMSYPIGGSIAVPKAFLEGVKKYRGNIKTNARVSKIVIECNKVRGVIVDDNFIESKIVISNAGIKRTVLGLTGEKYYENAYINKIKSLIPSNSSLTFKFALKKQIIPKDYGMVNIFHKNLLTSNNNSEDDKAKSTGFMTMIPSNLDPNLAPPGKQLIIFGTLAPPRSMNWKKWTDKYYQEILENYPEIEDNIIFVDTSTPNDLAKISGKQFGPIESTALIPSQSGANRISSELPIEGLYVVGDSAGTHTHGIGTQLAADSAIKCADLIISKYKN